MSEHPQDSNRFQFTVGDTIADRYEICVRLGEGGMGVVFAVKDRQLDNQILALKILHPRYAKDEEVFTRFRNEVLVARSLSHPHIVRIYDFGRASDDLCYISMEYVDGLSLKQHIAKQVEEKQHSGDTGGLCAEEAIRLLRQILDGVAFAHQQGVVHRDLKPANIILTSCETVKLADFGTARVVKADTSLTQTGKIIGTPGYISPEQIRGERGSAASDIYALGIIAYELVTGEIPYKADSFVELAMKQLKDPIPPLPLDLNVPKWYETFIRRCATADRKKRFETLEDARAFVERNAMIPLGACRRRRAVLRSWVGRPKLVAGSVGGVALFSLLLFIFTGRSSETNTSTVPREVVSLASVFPDAGLKSETAAEVTQQEVESAELELERLLSNRVAATEQPGRARPRRQAPQSVALAVLDRTDYSSVEESRAIALEALAALDAAESNQGNR